MPSLWQAHAPHHEAHMTRLEPGQCITCVHPHRSRINAALLRGEPLRRVASTYGVSRSSLSRHQRQHTLDVAPEDQRAAPRALLHLSSVASKRGRDIVMPCPACGESECYVLGLLRHGACPECGGIFPWATLLEVAEAGRKAGTP